MKILVTGASGFIGSFIVEKGLTEGHAMWAGIRATSSRSYLQDSRIRFVELDMEHPEIPTGGMQGRVRRLGCHRTCSRSHQMYPT